MTSRIIVGDCLAEMRELEDASIDAIVSDPPYGLGFMGKEWDDLPPGLEFAVEAMRVLKPGGHLLAFGGTRTYHRLAVAIEDAGFEIRDGLMWIHAQGFPKSLDVSKAIDKAAGAEREVVGEREVWGRGVDRFQDIGDDVAVEGNATIAQTAPATDAAKEWEGWGTALKPAHEPIVLARKPLEGTVAANVQKWGTGALNIDGCRIDADGERFGGGAAATSGFVNGYKRGDGFSESNQGRWPANLAFDETAAEMLDEQSGEQKSGVAVRRNKGAVASSNIRYSGDDPTLTDDVGYGDTGGASRFFYCAKTSKAERNAGLTQSESDRPVFGDDGGTFRGLSNSKHPQSNRHPTVKPIDLMRWLVRLVTPPNGIVLDPFLGSGTTGIAAHLEGFDFVGIEREAEYAEIAQARIDYFREFDEGTETKDAVKGKKKPTEASQMSIEDAA